MQQFGFHGFEFAIGFIDVNRYGHYLVRLKTNVNVFQIPDLFGHDHRTC